MKGYTVKASFKLIGASALALPLTPAGRPPGLERPEVVPAGRPERCTPPSLRTPLREEAPTPRLLELLREGAL